MKKILVMLAALAVMLPMVAAPTDGELTKSDKKEVKTVAKRLEKEKWSVVGTRTIEGVLTSHREKMKSNDDCREIVGQSTRTMSKTTAVMHAKTSAINRYVMDAASNIQARIVQDMQANGVELGAEFENFFANFERLIETEISGEVQESFVLMRQNEDKSFEANVYCVVSEKAASKARIRAAQAAMAEANIAANLQSRIAQIAGEQQ